jgi:propanediol dehydratase small subunit
MSEYPLSEKRRERLRTPAGHGFDEITLDAVLTGRIGMQDLRVTEGALQAQAAVARSAGRRQLAENLDRAAELVGVPDEKILRIYNALRPGRATKAELLAVAGELESEHKAPLCAALVREAAEMESA